eukprot:6191788-Pleurochrysis_carterae.AAC.1
MDEAGWGRTLYRYRSEAALDAIERYAQLAQESGMSLTELSLRFTRQRLALTSALLGVSSLDQLEQNLAYFRNPEMLDDELMWEIDRIHMRNRLPIFSSTRVERSWFGRGEIGEPIP